VQLDYNRDFGTSSPFAGPLSPRVAAVLGLSHAQVVNELSPSVRFCRQVV